MDESGAVRESGSSRVGRSATGTPVIVVGMDGSEHGDRAVLRAAVEAVRAGARLRILHAVRVPIGMPGFEAIEPGPDVSLTATALVEAAAADVRARHPGVDVVGEVALGLPADALLAAAEDATLLVAGSRGRGGFAGLMLGSVSRSLAARTPCPLLVVRGREGADGDDGRRSPGTDILVGVQGEGDDMPALREAFTLARRWDLPVRAVHAWSWPGYVGLAGPTEDDMRAVAEVHAKALTEALVPARVEFPGVAVREESVLADAAAALMDASATSAVAVVGMRRRRGLLRHSVGHVASTAIEHADCPVLAVPIG